MISDEELADRLEQDAIYIRKAAHPSRMGEVPNVALTEMLFTTETTLRLLARRLRNRDQSDHKPDLRIVP